MDVCKQKLDTYTAQSTAGFQAEFEPNTFRT